MIRAGSIICCAAKKENIIAAASRRSGSSTAKMIEETMDTMQPIEYTNRLGKMYYLFQDKTKKGNPRYFFSPSSSGGKTECVPLDRIPEGYELFEHPNSNVVLRKKIKTAVLPRELFFVRDMVEELERVDGNPENGSIIKHLSENLGFCLPGKIERYKRSLVWRYRAEIVEDSIIVCEVRYNQAIEVLRFDLIDEKTRRYDASRIVFTGRGHWRSLVKTGPIEEVAAEYCPRLNTEDFFELL
jgi:hypothetical protein